MKELDLLVPTADGPMPVFATVPQDVDLAPGVLLYMDVFGPREELRDMARRFTSCGYVAVLPQLFHRLGSPVFEPANRANDPIEPEVVAANDATSMKMTADDTAAILRFAASGGLGVTPGLWGAIGYCMGGRHAISAAVQHPQQVRAALSVHGGRLVDDSEASPHRLASRTRVPLHFALANDDPTCPPDHQQALERIAADSKGLISVEHIDALHGWSFPDRWCFDRRACERVWEKALALFRSTLWTRHAPRRR